MERTAKQKAWMERLKAFEGVQTGGSTAARDPVNPPMIRHWCDAVGDRNPVYTDPAFAERSVHGGIVAPPTMLQAWIMPGLLPQEERQARPAAGFPEILEVFDEAGFTSVVATNCEQEYARYLRPGDRLSVTPCIESVSEEKETALGPGHFITQRMTYRDQNGEVVATMRLRLLKFRPPAEAAAYPPRTERPRRWPRPAITLDNEFFWRGVQGEKLLIQRCRPCGKLRHPPGPMCPSCHSLEWDAVEASGRGTVYSYVVAHHPPIPPFAYPNLIALVELEEGTRIVANLSDVDPADAQIGMPVEAWFATVEDGYKLLQFRPARAPSRPRS